MCPGGALCERTPTTKASCTAKLHHCAAVLLFARVELRLLILSVRTHKHRAGKGAPQNKVQCEVRPSEKRRFVWLIILFALRI